MMNITVSIISYNQVYYLQQAIDSVLRQTRKPDRLLIIDDHSHDGSQDLIRSYKNNYPDLIETIFHTSNKGIIFSRNEALKNCKEGLHTFLDGDDRFMDEKLEKELIVMERYNHDVIVFSNIIYIDENGHKLFTWADEVTPSEGDVFVQVFSRDFPRNNLFRSELVNINAYWETGEFDSNLDNLYEDYDMRIRLSKKFRTAYCDVPLSEYRLHGSGLSRKGKEAHLRALKYIYNKNKPLLDDLPANEISYINNRITNFLARLSLRASMDALGEVHLRNAIRYMADFILYKSGVSSIRGEQL